MMCFLVISVLLFYQEEMSSPESCAPNHSENYQAVGASSRLDQTELGIFIQ